MRAWIASAGSRQLASRSMCGSRRPSATSDEQPVEHPGGSAALGQLGEDHEAVDARAGSAAEERARGVLDVRARVAVGERDDRAVGRHALDGGAERGAADALGDRVEHRPLRRELVDDLVGAELGEAAGALGAGRDGGDVRAADVGELDGEAPDAAARAGHQHAPRDRVAADVEGQQRGDAGHGQRRRLGEADPVGQHGERMRGDRGELRPRLVVERRRRGRPRAGRCRRPPARRTVPARSQPVREPGGLPASPRTSPRLSEMASTAMRASLGSGSGSGASASSTPGSAEEVRRASTGRTLPIGVRLPAVRESTSWTRTPTRARWPLPTPRGGASSRTRGSRRWRRARGRRGARGPRRTAGCARRCSATATGSCTPRPSGASSTRRRSSSRPRATTTARG